MRSCLALGAALDRLRASWNSTRRIWLRRLAFGVRSKGADIDDPDIFVGVVSMCPNLVPQIGQFSGDIGEAREVERGAGTKVVALRTGRIDEAPSGHAGGRTETAEIHYPAIPALELLMAAL